MKPHIICDSGAFGAWRMGIHIDLERYIEFCQRYQDQLVAVANLDVIPGVFGKIPSMAEVEESAQKGWANLKYMERHGVNAMPIFHQGESFKWLTRMLEEGYEYIGISPDNGKNVKQKQAWLDQVFTIITDRDGLPYVNTHGYAVTSVDLMYRYPWACMDDQHEVLTREGWKGKDEIKEGDSVLAYDDGVARWEPIQKVHKYAVQDEELVQFSSRVLSACVTSNHRWRVRKRVVKYVDDKYTRTYHWEWADADKLHNSHRIPRVPDDYESDEKVYSDEIVELMGWVWTDGSIERHDDCKKDYITITQSLSANPGNVVRIRELLVKSGEVFSERVADSPACTYRGKAFPESSIAVFRLKGRVRDQIIEIFGGHKQAEKVLPMEFVVNLTKHQLSLFIEASLLGDGSPYGKNGDVWQLQVTRQSKRKSLEVFRVACLLAGRVTSLTHYDDCSNLIVSNDLQRWASPCTGERKTVLYTGEIWCITVPSGAFFTRRNGKICVTGNSCDSATWIQLGAFGGTMVPRGLNGDYTYRKAPYVVNISSKGNSTMRQGQHFKNFGPATQRHIIDFFEQQGFSYSQVADTFEARSYLCLRVFEGVKRELVNPVFRHRVSDFFLAQYTPKGLTSFQIPQVEVYYALSSASIYSDMLTVEGLANRIYTYQILKDKPEGFFDFYLRNGVCPTDKCWKRYCDAGNIGAEKPLEFIQPDYSRNNRKPETKVRDWKGNRRKA